MNKLNVQLTRNFWIKEFLEGTAMSKEAIDLNYKHLDFETVARIDVIAVHLQIIRDRAKAKFKDRLKGLEITCGLRVLEWELLQGRSGKGQHPNGWAADFQPICKDEDYMEIFNWIFNEFEKDWNGGFAKKEPNLKEDKKGFIHADRRLTGKARWTY